MATAIQTQKTKGKEIKWTPKDTKFCLKFSSTGKTIKIKDDSQKITQNSGRTCHVDFGNLCAPQKRINYTVLFLLFLFRHLLHCFSASVLSPF